jgi:thioredoxin-like negative regulator of GroEL
VYNTIFFFFLVLAIKNGREISRFTGAADEDRIQKMIDQLSR